MKITNPFTLFQSWLLEAEKCGLSEPYACTLATSTKEGAVSARQVLLRKFDSNGFTFFTNLNSRKASELYSNPQAALCFYWMPLKKQVRVEGIVSLVSDEEADNYFASRPRESRIGSWASKQSQVMEQESDLLERYSFYEQKFFNQSVPRPPFWSGYRITPTYLEFWQEGSHRLHHRICYRKMDNLWEIKQLYP